MTADITAFCRPGCARAPAFDDAQGADPGEAGVGEIMTAYRDRGALCLQARRAQVAVRNVQRMATDEYRWIRARTCAALGQPVAVVAPDGAAQAQVVRVSHDTRAPAGAHRETLTDN